MNGQHFKLEVSMAEAELILNALGELRYRDSANIIHRLQAQISVQMNPPVSSTPMTPKPDPTS